MKHSGNCSAVKSELPEIQFGLKPPIRIAFFLVVQGLVYICMLQNIYIYIYIYMYVCIYVCIYVCMYIIFK